MRTSGGDIDAGGAGRRGVVLRCARAASGGRRVGASRVAAETWHHRLDGRVPRSVCGPDTEPLPRRRRSMTDSTIETRSVHFDGPALTGEVIHDVQRPEVASIRQRVGGKVHRPAFQPLTGRRQWHALGARRPLAPPARTCSPAARSMRCTRLRFATTPSRSSRMCRRRYPNRARTATCAWSRARAVRFVALVCR